jgi:hypothetical protein
MWKEHGRRIFKGTYAPPIVIANLMRHDIVSSPKILYNELSWGRFDSTPPECDDRKFFLISILIHSCTMIGPPCGLLHEILHKALLHPSSPCLKTCCLLDLETYYLRSHLRSHFDVSRICFFNERMYILSRVRADYFGTKRVVAQYWTTTTSSMRCSTVVSKKKNQWDALLGALLEPISPKYKSL